MTTIVCNGARRPSVRSLRLAAVLGLAVMLGACASTGSQTGGSSGTPKSGQRGGGYYLDDGPGSGAPVDLAAIPDAVPRAEPLLTRANRPYEVFGRRYVPMTTLEPYRKRGVASWYGRRYHGNRTSSGEVYDMYAMTAAHPTLPLPSYVRVTHLGNGRSVVVRVNDRGPFLNDRVIDLSWTAAAKLGFVEAGSAEVEVELFADPGRAATLASAPAEAGVGPVAASAAARQAQSEAPPVLTMTSASTGAGASAPPIGGSATPVPATVPAGNEGAQRATERLTVETLSGEAPTQSSPSAPLAAGPVQGDADRASQPAIRPETHAPPATTRGAAPAGAAHYLQFGALASRDGAESLRQRVARELGWPAEQLSVHPDGGLFKLHAGPFAGRNEALAVAEQVRRATSYRPFTVQR